jgi:hypothetical protein
MRHGLVWMCVLGGLMMVGLADGRPPAPETANPVLDKVTHAEVRKLQEKRRDVLRQALDVRTRLYQSARAELGGVIETSKRLLTLELDLAATDAERIAAHERYLEKARAYVELAKAKHESGQGNLADVLDAREACLAAEVGLLRAGGKPKKVKE